MKFRSSAVTLILIAWSFMESIVHGTEEAAATSENVISCGALYLDAEFRSASPRLEVHAANLANVIERRCGVPIRVTIVGFGRNVLPEEYKFDFQADTYIAAFRVIGDAYGYSVKEAESGDGVIFVQSGVAQNEIQKRLRKVWVSSKIAADLKFDWPLEEENLHDRLSALGVRASVKGVGADYAEIEASDHEFRKIEGILAAAVTRLGMDFAK